jgi:adenylate cyclase
MENLMTTTTTEPSALLLEALSDKVLHQLPPAVWRGLFLGTERESIRFEELHLSLVHVDADARAAGSASEHFSQELQRLNARHHGRLDAYVNATALITFEDPGAAVRMALDLQRAAAGMALRIGVVSGLCTLAYFRVRGRLWCTPLGEQPLRAAEVAAAAPLGGLVISPETYVPEAAHAHAHAADAPEFGDSEVDLSSLAFDTASEAIDIH